MTSKQIDILNDEDDPLTPIINDIMARVRAEIGSHKNNKLDDHRWKIPPELVTAACHLIIESLQSRVPTMQLTHDQIRNADNARKLLVRVAKGDVKITRPFPKILAPAPPAEPPLRRRRNFTSRFKLRGL